MDLKESLLEIISICEQEVLSDPDRNKEVVECSLGIDFEEDFVPSKVATYLEDLDRDDVLQLCAAMDMGRDYQSANLNINIPHIFDEKYLNKWKRDFGSDTKEMLIDYLSSKMPRVLKDYFNRTYEILFLNTDNYASEVGVCCVCGSPVWLPEPYNYADSWYGDDCLVEFYCLKCTNKWTKTVNHEWLDSYMLK